MMCQVGQRKSERRRTDAAVWHLRLQAWFDVCNLAIGTEYRLTKGRDNDGCKILQSAVLRTYHKDPLNQRQN